MSEMEPKKESAQTQNSNTLKIIKYLSLIYKEVGLVGFIAIILSVIFLGWGSSEQKKRIY